MTKSDSVQWIAMGLLVGYLGLNAWDLVKSWKQDAKARPAQKNAQTSHV
jgi:hypothetical protein